MCALHFVKKLFFNKNTLYTQKDYAFAWYMVYLCLYLYVERPIFKPKTCVHVCEVPIYLKRILNNLCEKFRITLFLFLSLISILYLSCIFLHSSLIRCDCSSFQWMIRCIFVFSLVLLVVVLCSSVLENIIVLYEYIIQSEPNP